MYPLHGEMFNAVVFHSKDMYFNDESIYPSCMPQNSDEGLEGINDEFRKLSQHRTRKRSNSSVLKLWVYSIVLYVILFWLIDMPNRFNS